MSHFSAVLLVLLAGTMWAASGTAAQHFYTQSVHIPIELTQVRLFLSSALFFLLAWWSGGLRRGVRSLRRNPRLLAQLSIHGILGIMIVQFSYFMGIAEGDAAATTVKVVCDQGGLALYFSRAAIPYVRDADGVSGAFPYLRHIGIYAYRVAALKRYPQLAATPLEQAEKLEQLRFLEHGLRIAVGVVNEAPPPGVDCEEDLQRVEAFLRGAGAV